MVVRIRWLVIVVLGLVGLIWIGQGLGLIRGSGFMTDDIRWALIGIVLLAVAAAMGFNEWRRSRSSP